jgi:ribosomal protein L11 methyltransferase
LVDTGRVASTVRIDAFQTPRCGAMVRYVSLSCELPVELEDELAGVLSGLDVLGSQIHPSTAGIASATVYVEESRSDVVARICRRLYEFGVGPITTAVVEDRDWLAVYREYAQPFEIGRLWWIDPHPSSRIAVPEGRIRLEIEPSSAFGSGTHETTRLALLLLEQMEVTGRRVLDVGTGCGILAFAACALSARTVVALDIDPEAVWVARRMAASQELESRPMLLAAPVQSLGPVQFDIILCNMISGELLPLLPELHRLLKRTGQMVLSGLLNHEIVDLTGALGAARFRVAGERRLGEWLALEVVRD